MSHTITWRLRPDLVWGTIQTADGLMHAVKDPVTGRFFYFDPREFSILKRLDGRTAPSDVVAAVRQSRPDELFSTEALLKFFADLHHNGLLLIRGQTRIPKPPTARRSLPLTWKIPLFNPATLIQSLRPAANLLFSKPLRLGWLAAVLSALLLIATRFDEVLARWPAAQAWATPSMSFTILAVLLGCKIVHELAHALVADRYGVRVQECGIMLFYLLPCFYCDVSDGWLVRSSRSRILISAAGILVELGLAALATWLWWFSHPGPIQSICLAVMVTCSINTLLINGNPLLRFDGYFVLVDLLGMPNLAPRAAAWWRSAWNRWIYGLPGDQGPGRESLLLATYGAASFVYRILVLTALLWTIHRAFDARGAGALSLGLMLIVTLGMAQSGWKTALHPWRNPGMRSAIRPARAITSLLALTAGTAIVLFVPLPRSVRSDILIEPALATNVFVSRTGVLKSLRPAGSRVRKGDVIAELADFETTAQLADLESQRTIAERRLESARIRHTVHPLAGQEIPTLIESLATIGERLTLLRRAAADLQIKAPSDGVLLPPPNTPPGLHDDRTPAFWHGSPFDARNLGCTLRQGTCLAVIAASRDASATAFISQRSIEHVRPGQHARLAVDGCASLARTGIVEEISPAPIEELPRELSITRRIPLAPGSSPPAKPLEPMYRVEIRLEQPSLPAPIGALGTARVSVDSASLGARTWALLNETFRFDL